MFEIYIIVAFSFALSSVFFIHRKGLKQHLFEWPIIYDIIYIILATLLFPLFFMQYVIEGSEETARVYGEYFIKGLKK